MDTQKAKEILQTFKELYEDGLISESEFIAKKQEILKLLGNSSTTATKAVANPNPPIQPKTTAAPMLNKPPTPPPVVSPKVVSSKQPQSSIDDALDDFITGMMSNRFSVATTPSYLAPKNVATMSDHKGYVFAVYVKGSKLYTASGDHSFKVWNLQSLKAESGVENAHDGNVSTIIVHDKYIITGGWDKLIKMWDISSPHDLKFTLTGHTNYVTRLIIRDGKLFSGSWDCTIQVWDLDTKKVIATMLKENTNGKQTGGHFGSVSSFAFTLDGTLVSAGYDGRIKVEAKFDLSLSKFWSNTFVNKKTIAAHSDWIFAIVIYKDKYVISASRDFTIKVFALEKGDELYTLKSHTDMVTSLWLEGTVLYSGSMDKTVKLWDAENKFTLLATLSGHKNNVYSMFYANKSLYTGSWDRSIKIWQ